MAVNLQMKFAAGGRGSTLRHRRHLHRLQLNQMMARRGVHLALHPASILWFPHGLALLDDCRPLMGRRLPCGVGSRGAWWDAAVGLGLLLGAIVMDRILLLSWVLLGDRMEQLCTFLLVSKQEIQTYPLEFQPEWWMQAYHHLLGPVYIGSPFHAFFWGGGGGGGGGGWGGKHLQDLRLKWHWLLSPWYDVTQKSLLFLYGLLGRGSWWWPSRGDPDVDEGRSRLKSPLWLAQCSAAHRLCWWPLRMLLQLSSPSAVKTKTKYTLVIRRYSVHTKIYFITVEVGDSWVNYIKVMAGWLPFLTVTITYTNCSLFFDFHHVGFQLGKILQDPTVPLSQLARTVPRFCMHKAGVPGADWPVPCFQHCSVFVQFRCLEFPENVFLSEVFVSVELFVINKLIYLEPWRHIVFLVGCEVCEGLDLLRWSYRRALWPWGRSGARLTGLLRCDHRGRLLLCLLLFFLYLRWCWTGSAFPVESSHKGPMMQSFDVFFTVFLTSIFWRFQGALEKIKTQWPCRGIAVECDRGLSNRIASSMHGKLILIFHDEGF